MRVFRTKELTLGYRHALWLYALDKEGMGVHPLYTSHYNALLVPIGTAHRPLFSIDANKYANYGALGTAIAYEMIHSINELGSLLLSLYFSYRYIYISIISFIFYTIH